MELKVLKFSKETAQKRFAESPIWFKEVLIETFGEKAFKPKDFRDIQTMNDVFLEVGMTEQEFHLRYGNIGLDDDTINYEKAKLMAKAINQGWLPDWNKQDEKKWYPYFEVSPSGAGFSDSAYNFTRTGTDVGSRLCFESREKAEHAGKKFIEIYNQFLF